MQLHFQSVRRDFQTLHPLAGRHRTVRIRVVHHDGNAITQHGAVNHIGILRTRLRCTCLLAGGGIKITGICKLGILLQRDIVLTGGRNRQSVTENRGRRILIFLIAFHPHTDLGLQCFPVFHGQDVNAQGIIADVVLSYRLFLVTAHDLNLLAIPNLRQNISAEVIGDLDAGLIGICVQLHFHPGSYFFRVLLFGSINTGGYKRGSQTVGHRVIGKHQSRTPARVLAGGPMNHLGLLIQLSVLGQIIQGLAAAGLILFCGSCQIHLTGRLLSSGDTLRRRLIGTADKCQVAGICRCELEFADLSVVRQGYQRFIYFVMVNGQL